ncbi:hypothetical protein QNO07_24295 [Streptomyces sp. 549]|uniref:hypothetical protein n=1 Tax=Streptomyces sp. 549 TaxID=3049076 RepID=UPI0024C35059|nr:hypothetical protein [Streptomyces sp. 549]MDK1476485.1 hypothetical protein [Streptomyces sp. 549]
MTIDVRATPENAIPPLRQLDALLDAFDSLVVEPPRSRTAAVLLLLAQQDQGDAARSVVQGLRDRCIDSASRPLAPVALWPPDHVPSAADRVQFYDDLAAGLRETRPADTGRLAFRDYDVMRVVVEASLPGRGGDAKAVELRRQLHRARYPGHPGGPPPLVDVLPWFGGLLLWLWGVLVQPLYGWRLERRMMRGWFAGWAQVALRARQNGFLECAVHLAGSGRLHTPEHIDAVLTRALLADLERAFRGRWWSPWRRRRTTRFVILLSEAAEPGPPGGRRPGRPAAAAGDPVPGFLAAYLSAVEHLATTGTVVVAATGPGRPDALRIGIATSPAAAAHTLTEDGGPLRAAAVQVSDPGATPADGVPEWLDEHPKIPDRQGPTGSPRIAAALQSVTVVVALGLVYSGLGAAGVPLPTFAGGAQQCPAMQFPSRNGHGCLGLSDGTEPFSGMAEQYEPLLAMIARNNADVDTLAAHGHEVRTVVHLAPFTAGATFSELVEGGVLPELRGVALQQRELIKEARNNSRKVGIRVLLANAGPLFGYAEEVAEHIRDRAADEKIVGVIGLGQSRPGTKKAIKALDGASLPMVGTSATADEMIEQSPQYYQVAPINRRAAQAAVSFLRHEDSVALPDGRLGTAKSVVVVNDPDDPYSSNLGEDFVAAFRQEIGDSVSVLGYSPEGGRIPVSANDLATQACAALAKEPATVVFWAARAREMLAFLDEFRKVPACGGRITVLGGDDLTNSLIQEENPVARYPGLTLHHVAHAVPGIDRPTLEVETFVSRYQDAFGRDDIMLNDGHPALGWDALKVLAHAVNLARGTSNNPDFDRATVSAKLRSSDNSVQGSTGVLDFTRDKRPVAVPVDKPVYVIKDEVSGPVVVLKCGNFGAGQYRKRWGDADAHRCPSD